MDPHHLEELIALERTYWWHVSKRALVLQLLRAHAPPCLVVEGGVGGGGMLQCLKDQGYTVAGFDLLPEAVAHCHALGLKDVTLHDLQQPWPIPPQSVGAVLLLDVLEHLAQPEQALREAAQALTPQGVVLLTVPSYPALRGPWDDRVGHLRRYTVPALRQMVAAAHLRVRWMSHWNAFSLPPAVLMRGWERARHKVSTAEFPRVPPVINAGLILAARAERALMRRFPLPAGLSLCAVLEDAA
jgi:SAM-dependent methyltransferase